MRTVWTSILVLLASCGGSGGGGVSVEGQIVVIVPSAEAQRAPRAIDAEPDSVLGVPLGAGAATGVLERADDIDVFRRLAQRDGPVFADRVEGRGVTVLLHDLVRGIVAPTLHLRTGDAFDVIVFGAADRFRVELRPIAVDGEPRALPERYRDLGDGYEPNEIVVAPRAGWNGARLARHYGLTCLVESPTACLLETPAHETPRDAFGAACAMACLCAQMEADGFVRYAEPNLRRRLAAEPDDELFPAQWAMQQIGAPAAWNVAREAPEIVVAYVDAGIRPDHPDLAGRIVAGGYDFRDGDDDPLDPTPNFSHGTQVAGVLAAATNNGIGLAGMIWNGRVLPIRAFGTNGFGSAFDIAEAIRYGAGLENVSGTVPLMLPRVMNLSFASTAQTTVEREACAAAQAEGVFLVAATGNAGRRNQYYPAAYDSVFAVGASNINRLTTGYSNSGAYVDLVAPGGDFIRLVQVLGIDRDGIAYPLVEGTSFAAPLVAATAALMLTLREATPIQLGDILRNTAQDIEAPGYDERSGFGILDAFAALVAAAGADTPLLGPGERVTIRVFKLPENTLETTLETSENNALAFSIQGLAAGEYRIVAGTDRDADMVIEEPGEISGVYRAPDDREVLVVDPRTPPTPIQIMIQKR